MRRSLVVKDICIIRSGKRLPKGHDFSEIETPYKYIRARDIKGGKIDDSNLAYINKETQEKISRYIVNAGDVVITIAGTIGEIGYVTQEFDGFNLTENAIRLTDFSSDVDSQFVAYWLLLPSSHEHMTGVAAGSAQPKMGIYKVEQIPITLPDLLCQQRIVSILSAYDSLIETNQRQIKLLEEAAQRLYREWFVDLRFPGHEHVPVVDGVPEGWKKAKLIEVCSVLRRGISPAYNETGAFTVISQKCIRQAIMNIGEARRQEKEYLPELNLQDSDIVICSTGTGTLGRVGQVFGDYNRTTFDSHVTLVRAKRNPEYVYHTVKAREEYLMGMGRGSTNQQELYRNVIEELEILLPPEDIVIRAEQLLSNIHGRITALNNQISGLTEARDRLLPKLMNGEIEV